MRVIGTDTDGSLICEDESTGEQWNCGENREDFGEHNLTQKERDLLDMEEVE